MDSNLLEKIEEKEKELAELRSVLEQTKIAKNIASNKIEIQKLIDHGFILINEKNQEIEGTQENIEKLVNSFYEDMWSDWVLCYKIKRPKAEISLSAGMEASLDSQITFYLQVEDSERWLFDKSNLTSSDLISLVDNINSGKDCKEETITVKISYTTLLGEPLDQEVVELLENIKSVSKYSPDVEIIH